MIMPSPMFPRASETTNLRFPPPTRTILPLRNSGNWYIAESSDRNRYDPSGNAFCASSRSSTITRMRVWPLFSNPVARSAVPWRNRLHRCATLALCRFFSDILFWIASISASKAMVWLWINSRALEDVTGANAVSLRCNHVQFWWVRIRRLIRNSWHKTYQTHHDTQLKITFALEISDRCDVTLQCLAKRCVQRMLFHWNFLLDWYLFTLWIVMYEIDDISIRLTLAITTTA